MFKKAPRSVTRNVTERSDEAVAVLAAIVESSTDAIVSKDLEGVVTSWNAGAQKLFGYEPAEIIGQPITWIIPVDRLDEESEILAKLRRGERVNHFETERLRKDGTLIPVSVSASPIRNSFGEVIGASKVARDISQRRLIEQSLRESEARFHRIFDGMLEGCQIIGFDWSYLYVNDSVARHSRVTREELLGRTMLEVFPGLERTAIFAVLERCMTERIPDRRETLFEFPDGSYAWFEMSVQPAPEGIFILSIDITERKQAESALRKSDDRFRQIAESLPQLIWTASPDGECDFVSQQWEQYTGVATDLLLGTRWVERVHPEDRARLREEWRAAIDGGVEFRAEFRLQRHDGAYRWFVTRATQLRDAQGGDAKWFGSNADIDDLRRVREHQLRSQKMEALGTLAGGIAHDFNNILLAICGNVRLAIADLPSGHPVLESLSEIDRAGTRATDLVRRILAFSRQEQPKRTVIQLRSVIEEALKLLRPTLPARIELRFQCSDEVPATIADSSQLHQIIMNLLTNAAHAIGARAGIVEISLVALHVDAMLARTAHGLREGSHACLTVTDNGCGMDKGTLERIFDPFFTTKPVGQGTGLGLSVVDGIMKSHGGVITVESQPGNGTTFSLYFPAAQDVTECVPEPLEAIPLAKGQRVLYVDDDDALVFLAKRMLGRLGYDVTGYTDPRAALEMFRAHPDAYDVVVTDLSMPAMSGTELAREILAVRAGLPVVITSGYVRPEDQMTAQRLGAAAVVLKPNSIEELGHTLDRLIRRHPTK